MTTIRKSNNLRIIDTSLAQLITSLKLDSSKTIVCVVDAESTRLLGKGGIIWDFGYTFGNVMTGSVAEPEGSLVYESIKDKRLIDEIKSWNRVKNSYRGHLYDFYLILDKEGWWSDDEGSTSKEGIEKAIQDLTAIRATDAIEKAKEQLQNQRELRETANRKMAYHKNRKQAFQTMGSPTREHYRNRLRDAKKTRDNIKQIERFLEKSDNLDTLIKGKLLSEDFGLNKIKSDIYAKFYWEQRKYYATEIYDKDVERFLELEISYNIRRWSHIMRDFNKDLKAKSDKRELLAISAYNLGGAEQQYIPKTCEAYGTPKHSDILERYATICAQNFVALMKNLDVEKLVDGLSTLDPNFMMDGVAKALSNTKMADTVPMEIWFKTLYKDDNYTETHTAKGDSYDTALALTKVIKEEIVSILNKR